MKALFRQRSLFLRHSHYIAGLFPFVWAVLSSSGPAVAQSTAVDDPAASRPEDFALFGSVENDDSDTGNGDPSFAQGGF